MPFIKRHYAPKRKFCRFCEDKELVPDYKNTEVLKDFITERGKILARRVTGVCAKHQRQITKEIKRARNMALLIFTPTHDTGILKKSSLREK